MDHSLAFLADPYRFISRHSEALGSDVFETRLMLQRTLCLRGADAAELFYDAERFQRAGAAPEPVRATLFGKGAVQGLDGGAHRARKAMFVAVTGAEQVTALSACVRRAWEDALPTWAACERLSLYRAIQPVLTAAVCEWAGVPLRRGQLAHRSAQFTALFDAAASGVGSHLWARLARWQAEAWLAQLVRQTRAGQPGFVAGSVADFFAHRRDPQGDWLPPRVVAVELLNLLRPTVAVSVYIAFLAHALHAHPGWRAALATAGAREALAFVQEVRRHYPFFPALAARVRRTFEWQGKVFVAGRRAMLDLYGTNHDARVWSEPMAFRPERWGGPPPHPFAFVPQGGADVALHHRCPGEDVATQLMLLSLEFLLHRMRYRVDPGSQPLLMHRLPAIPRHGLRLRAVAIAG